jgi:hypothetical protein
MKESFIKEKPVWGHFMEANKVKEAMIIVVESRIVGWEVVLWAIFPGYIGSILRVTGVTY